MASISENAPFTEEDSEDDFDWEEVDVPEHQEHLEITIPAAGPSRRKKDAAASKSKGIPHAERLRRIDCHKIHTVVLLGNAWVRNKWLNDELLHARLISVTPLALQNAFALIHKSRIPDQHLRGRAFEAAITNLVGWWSSTYFEIMRDGHIRNRTYDEVQARLEKLTPLPVDPEAVLDIEDVQDLFENSHEVIRSSKSLMKHALMQKGSRDASAQLFTALCRGLGIPARLVVSIQSVPWQTNVGKPKSTTTRKAKGKGKMESIDGVEDQPREDDDNVVVPSRSGSETPFSVKDKGKSFTGEGQRLDGTPVPKSDKAKGKQKAQPVITLRKTKSKGRVLGSTPGPSNASASRLSSPDPLTTPPVFWTEVFSRPDGRWIPVDPVRSIVNKRKVFDPTPTSASTSGPNSLLFPPAYAAAISNRNAAISAKNRASASVKQENRMVYVIALEEDGFARDVTRRYAREFGAKIAKVQGGSSTIGGRGKARRAWWERVLSGVTRPYRLHRDDAEDEELEAAQMTEAMPSTVTGFKDHPLYALTRHLKQNEVIHPPPPKTPELGKFRGEPVYPRSSVVSLKTAENWMRSEGRMVKEGCQALKMIKIRAGTINKMRELEVLKDELQEAGNVGLNAAETMQGLYARSQTEPYRPEPVVNGKIPKNNFGNIDLYVPSMLPRGAVHVPFKGVAKIARGLGFDFAEAVVCVKLVQIFTGSSILDIKTGFEFKKRRAFPILEGIVIAEENEAVLLGAYWDAEQKAEEKARAKREERVIKQWSRLVHGLRIRQRLQAQYATKDHHPLEESSATAKGAQIQAQEENVVTMSHPGVGAGGGFLVGADDVVEPFHLPKLKYQPSQPVAGPSTLHNHSSPLSRPSLELSPQLEAPIELNNVTYDLETMDVDLDLEEVANIGPPPTNGRAGPGPKSMLELAEDEARQQEARDSDTIEVFDMHGDADVYRPSPEPSDVPKIKVTSRPVRINSTLPAKPTITKAPSVEAVSPPPTRARKGRERATRGTARIKSKKRPLNDNDSTQDGSADEESTPPPKKRATAKARRTVTVTHVASTRTLRPRACKTATQLKEAQELEDAYRRAIE
ncbi:hypothetical protein H0H81_010542 [Sphagnurus paluster]|uniref:Rad4-domain-containing protein n=1 Tax=Sphagnurus paluster TaxID=117069 RepID=A0A9P7FUA4_9AGAR|nr:hypothetical protein H0H81_010542 [Sphagnurus paluster]